jgi:uncharacterized protein (DUF362 family)
MARSRRKIITRRDFLRMGIQIGGLAAAASLLAACQQNGRPTPTAVPPGLVVPHARPSATPSPSPAPPQEEDMAQVAFVKTRDRAQGVAQALQLLGFNPVQGRQVLLKPNFNSAHRAPASTHPQTLRALVAELWDMGARSITVADRSGMGVTRDVMQKLDIFDMAEELGFEALPFDDLAKADWVPMQPIDSHWQKGFAFARPCLEAEALVQTCCLKPHRFGGHFTMSLKNSVGMIASVVPGDSYNYMNELHSSPHQRLMIAEINTAYKPALVVLDGVEAFISAGPEQGAREWGEVVLAGTDRVAIDAVGLALLRHLGYRGIASQGPIFEQEQIARAVELGLGVDSPAKIEFATGDADSEAYAAVIREVLLGG